MNTAVQIKPAASVVLVRETRSGPEVLLLQKNQNLKFAGNFWVFPGGKVDATDYSKDDSLETANRVAAIRECHEETGLRIDASQLIPISHWTTPKMQPRRYATQFFFQHLTAEQAVTIDDSEIVDYRWLSATQALDLYRSGELKLMPPTIVSLTEIERHQDCVAIRQFYLDRGNRVYKPLAVFHEKPSAVQQGFPDGVLLYEGDSGYEERIADIGEKLNRCTIEDGIISHQCNLDVY